jgi:hypothetical protein
MNFTTLNRKSLALSLLVIGTMPLSALAAPSDTSPYVTDTQNSYVQDATSDGISNLNMVLCIMDSMKPADMVNKGNYIALVDKNKCDTKSQSSASNSTSGSSGASSAPDYMTAVVNVSRASNSDPMIGKIWMSMTEEGHAVDIYVHLTATQSPTDAPPYGQFRLDYIGKSSGTTQFNGFIDANGADVSYLETGGNSSNNALTLTATSTTAGSGTMDAMDQNNTPVTFNFAYDSSETNFPAGVFRRDDGTHDVCFDRSKANAKKSVWRYGTYNADDGSRVDQANPGFPVLATYGGNSYYGYASYWGVNFQGLDLNGFADGSLSGVTIADQRPGNSAAYTLSKNSGKLTKWTRNQATLAAMDGIPFTFWGDLANQTNDTTNVTGFNSWQMKWDNASGKFMVIGAQTCGNNGCVVTSLPQEATVTGTVFDNMPISGWADSFGGNINIPPHTGGGAHVSGDEVDYYTQSDVIPGSASAPTALHCLSNCPTTASVTGFNNGTNLVNSNNSPFDSTTATQWNSGTVAVDYSFDAGGLKDSSGYLAFINANMFTGQYQNGVMSGRLFDVALPTSGCPNGGTVCEPGNPSVYYTWQTGPNQWNQSMWLTKASDSSVVSFDPPENVAYTVPGDSAVYGSWAGKSIQLQFNGFGNLNGIPGGCVDPTDNSPTDCGTAGARYVPEFSLPDGATMTPTSSNTPLIVKALDSELRLAKVDCATASLAQPSTNATLPSASDVHDPSSSSDVDYLGTEPAVTDAPKVIDGVIQ